MTEKTKLVVKGRVRLTIRDAKTGEVIEERPWRENLVTNAGIAWFIALIHGDAPAPLTHEAVGSGTTPAAAGDTALEMEIGRVAFTDSYTTSTTVSFVTFFSSSDCAGTWNETGLFTAASGGTLVARNILSPSVTKNSTNTVTVTHVLSVSAEAD